MAARLRSGGGYVLSEAAQAQAYLEAQVFFKLDTSGFWWAHPTGIARADAEVDCAVVHFDPATLSESGTSFTLAEHVLGALLPYASPDEEETTGVNGLRLRAVAGNKLVLGSADEQGSLTLIAEP